MLTTYAGPVIVTLALILVYYGFMVLVLLTKQRLLSEYKARGERFDRYYGQDREMLAADRNQLNLLEHMPPILMLLWLNAVFVSTTFATALGAFYVASRLLYPAMMGAKVGSQPPKRIFISTLPGYLVLIGYVGALIWALISALTFP